MCAYFKIVLFTIDDKTYGPICLDTRVRFNATKCIRTYLQIAPKAAHNEFVKVDVTTYWIAADCTSVHNHQ